MIKIIGWNICNGKFKKESSNKILRLVAKFNELLSKILKFFNNDFSLKILKGTNKIEVKIVKNINIWKSSIIVFLKSNNLRNYGLLWIDLDQFF